MSLLTIPELAQLMDIEKYSVNQDEIDRIQQKTNLSDKLYVLEPKIQQSCVFCLEYAPKLIRCACGCTMCQYCLFSDFPAIPLGRCPYCASDINYTIVSNNQGVQFSFGPSGQQLNQAMLSINKTMKISELHPQREVIQQFGKGARLLCRNHEALVGTQSQCQFVTSYDDTFQTYLQHLETCKLNNQIENRHRYPSKVMLDIEQNSQQNSQQVQLGMQAQDVIMQNTNSINKSLLAYQRNIRPDLLAFQRNFGEIEAQLFKQNIFTTSEKQFYLHPHRSPVIPYILTRELYVSSNMTQESFQIVNSRPDYWNVQALIMANPLEPQDLRAYTKIIAGLRITLPDGKKNDFVLEVDITKLLNRRVLRFMGRINAKAPAMYQIELRIRLCIDDIHFHSHIKRFRIASIFGTKPTHISNVLQKPQFQQTKFGQRLSQAIQLLKIGEQMFKQKKEAEELQNIITPSEQTDQSKKPTQDGAESYVLTAIDIKNLLLFGSNANTLQDVCNFLVGIRGFCIVSLNTRQLIASSAFEIVSQQIDKYYNIYMVQRLITDLFYEIVQQQGDLNIILLKVPGLFGKLRRVKETLEGEDDKDHLASNVDKLLDGLFRVSIFSQHVDGKATNNEKNNKNENSCENATQMSEKNSEQKTEVQEKIENNSQISAN